MQTRKETREDKLRDEERLYSAAQEFAQVATEILTETIDAKGVFNILRDWYNNRAGRDDPKAMDKFERGEKVIRAEADRCAEEATASLGASQREVVRVSTTFSLRAELKGVEVAPGVTLRYWEAGAGRVLVMLRSCRVAVQVSG